MDERDHLMACSLYAGLAKHCYSAKGDLPRHVKLIFRWIPVGKSETCLTLYEVDFGDEGELVLAFRGSTKRYNFLTDIGLAMGAYEDNPQISNGQRNAEELVKFLQERITMLPVSEENHWSIETPRSLDAAGLFALNECFVAIKRTHRCYTLTLVRTFDIIVSCHRCFIQFSKELEFIFFHFTT